VVLLGLQSLALRIGDYNASSADVKVMKDSAKVEYAHAVDSLSLQPQRCGAKGGQGQCERKVQIMIDVTCNQQHMIAQNAPDCLSRCYHLSKTDATLTAALETVPANAENTRGRYAEPRSMKPAVRRATIARTQYRAAHAALLSAS